MLDSTPNRTNSSPNPSSLANQTATMTTLEKPTLAPAALQRQLEKPAPLDKKLALVHDVVRHYSDDIHRIAVALYDQDTDEISTFLYSSHENSPLLN